MERYCASSVAGMGGSCALFKEIFRKTAFTSPEAAPLPFFFASSTDSFTAARSGTLSKNRI